MAKTFRIGVLGLTHDHVWDNLKELQETGRAILAAAADPHPPLLDRVNQLYSCTTYASYSALLEKEKLDGVFLFGDNATGAELTVQAAEHGLPILIEKPMASSLADADRMLQAVRKAGVRLMVNWPFTWWPQLQHALFLAQSGDIGEIWQVKYRAAHAGPKALGCSPFFCDWLYDPARNGAGALMDYCCYGAALAAVLLGSPHRVTGVAGRLTTEDIRVEDNGILIMTYPHALAISEGSWTQVGKLTAYQTVIHGTRGTLFVEPRLGGRVLKATQDEPDGVALDVPALPAERRTASSHWLHCLENDTPFVALCSDRVGRLAQEILEAGLISARTGSDVSLPLKSSLS